MSWINHPALWDLRHSGMSYNERVKETNRRMGELGLFMGQFHVFTNEGRRYVAEAWRNTPGNPLGIVARLK